VEKYKNNQKGFSAVEVILVLIIVALIGVVGWLVHKNNNTSATTKARPNVSTPTNTAPVSDTYSGRKQYCSAHEKSCFKYPSSWSLTDNCSGGSDVCSDMDNVTVTSPNKSSIDFTSAITGRGGDCAGAPDSNITSVTALPKATGLYLVQFSRPDVNSIDFGVDDKVDGAVPKTGDTGACFMYTAFTAKNTPDADVDFSGTVDNSAKNADLDTALLIVKSYYYQ